VPNLNLTGLSQLDDLNTRGSVTLDKFLTNRLDLFQSVSVFSSIVKADHKAVLVKHTASQSSDLPRRNTQAHVKSVMYDHSPVHIGNLCKALENYSWTGLLLAIVDVDTAFAEFNAIVNYFVEKYIPSRTVCIKPKDPAFITPAIEYYLRKRNIVGLLNSALKSADDFTLMLIVPENTDVSAEDEMRDVL